MVKSYFSRIFDLITRPEMKVLPGQLAFFLVLSIFPLLTLIGFIISKITLLSGPFFSAVSSFFPKNIANILLPFVSQSSGTDNIALIAILGFILVSNGTYSIIVTSNQVFGIKDGDYLRGRLKALFMIFLLLFLFVFVFIVLAYGNNIFRYIINLDIFSNVRDSLSLIFFFFRWPVAFLILFWFLKVFYTVAPDEKISGKFMNKGALFTTVGWILATFVYSYYVTYIADYSLLYGSLSGIIIMMMWIYFLSYIFVMGIAINADEYLVYKSKHKKKKNTNNS
ncbi:MAG: YihY/virulence factor BrkB family protein [Bacilli bacterium]|nr:YihY/virulence factor BrkB family protein [Bacilli bacterium]